MITAVEGLIAELRKVGLPVSVSENIDAVRVLRHVDLGDREALKTALGSVRDVRAGRQRVLAEPGAQCVVGQRGLGDARIRQIL